MRFTRAIFKCQESSGIADTITNSWITSEFYKLPLTSSQFRILYLYVKECQSEPNQLFLCYAYIYFYKQMVRLVKGKGHLEFSQWLKKYYDLTYRFDKSVYDAKKRRKG